MDNCCDKYKINAFKFCPDCGNKIDIDTKNLLELIFKDINILNVLKCTDATISSYLTNNLGIKYRDHGFDVKCEFNQDYLNIIDNLKNKNSIGENEQYILYIKSFQLNDFKIKFDEFEILTISEFIEKENIQFLIK